MRFPSCDWLWPKPCCLALVVLQGMRVISMLCSSTSRLAGPFMKVSVVRLIRWVATTGLSMLQQGHNRAKCRAKRSLGQASGRGKNSLVSRILARMKAGPHSAGYKAEPDVGGSWKTASLIVGFHLLEDCFCPAQWKTWHGLPGKDCASQFTPGHPFSDVSGGPRYKPYCCR